jgi:hypothetical protein
MAAQQLGPSFFRKQRSVPPQTHFLSPPFNGVSQFNCRVEHNLKTGTHFYFGPENRFEISRVHFAIFATPPMLPPLPRKRRRPRFHRDKAGEVF